MYNQVDSREKNNRTSQHLQSIRKTIYYNFINNNSNNQTNKERTNQPNKQTTNQPNNQPNKNQTNQTSNKPTKQQNNHPSKQPTHTITLKSQHYNTPARTFSWAQ
jgi:hypothetical protein